MLRLLLPLATVLTLGLVTPTFAGGNDTGAAQDEPLTWTISAKVSKHQARIEAIRAAMAEEH